MFGNGFQETLHMTFPGTEIKIIGSILLFLLKGKHNINLLPANKSPKATDTFNFCVVISIKMAIIFSSQITFLFLNLLWVAEH